MKLEWKLSWHTDVGMHQWRDTVVTMSGDAQYWQFSPWPGPSHHFSATRRFSEAIKTLITSWIFFKGHEAEGFFNLAQGKPVTGRPGLPWIMFPSCCLFSYMLRIGKIFCQSSIFSVSAHCSKRPVLEMSSELWGKSNHSAELQESRNLGFSSFPYRSLALTTRAKWLFGNKGHQFLHFPSLQEWQ